MRKVLIFKPVRFPTQSGRRKMNLWTMEFINTNITETDPLTGWKNTNNHLHNCTLKFSSLNEAVSYAKKNNLEYEILEQKKNKEKIKKYSDNFKFRRVKTEI